MLAASIEERRGSQLQSLESKDENCKVFERDPCLTVELMDMALQVHRQSVRELRSHQLDQKCRVEMKLCKSELADAELYEAMQQQGMEKQFLDEALCRIHAADQGRRGRLAEAALCGPDMFQWPPAADDLLRSVREAYSLIALHPESAGYDSPSRGGFAERLECLIL
jgi:hypothetical protein